VTAKRGTLIWGAKDSQSAMDWSAVNARIVTAALQAILDADCALLIGSTRDHSAVTLKLYNGKTPQTIYVGTVEKLEAALLEAVEAFGSGAEDLFEIFGLRA